MSKALTVLAACVDIRSGKRFAKGDVFDPVPTVEQAKRLVSAECLPEAAVDIAAAAEAEAEKSAGRQELRDDGPTIAEYVAAGYPASTYPPKGYASRSTPEEIAEAEAAQKPRDPAAIARDQINNDGLFDMTVAELKELAGSEEIDLAEATRKDEIVAAIRAARAAKA